MDDHFRDTAFGYVVRLLSGRRWLKFPDEVDQSLWKQCIQRDSTATSSTSEQISGQGESSGYRTQLPTEILKEAEKAQAQGVDLESAPPTEKQDRNHTNGVSQNGNNVILVDWYGANDLEKPRNWSEGRKFLVTAQICVQNFAVYMGSAIYVPGEVSIMKEFGVSETVATLGLSLFVLGYGLGPMLFSPMSEMPKIGRSRIYFWTLFAFVLLQLPTGYAVNSAMLFVFRFLTGFLGGPVLSTGGATISDMYPPEKLLYGISIWGAFGILGPVLGPLVGGFAAEVKGWRWTIWELAWLCTVMLAVIFFLMPETSADNILYQRAKRLRSLTGNARLRSQSEIDAAEVSVLKDHLVMLGRAFTIIFSKPLIFILDLYTALVYGVLYLWFESFPLVFGDMYHFSMGQQGLVFLGIFVGALITVPCYLLWLRYAAIPRVSQPDFKPETLLPPTFFGAFALPICLFWYGWTSNPNIHWIVPIIGSGIFTISIVTLFFPVLSYLGMLYPQYAASVYAGNSLFRALFGVIFPLFARDLFRNLGVGPGNSLLGGLAVIFIPIPLALYYYGERIRHWRKKERQG